MGVGDDRVFTNYTTLTVLMRGETRHYVTKEKCSAGVDPSERQN